MGRLLFIEVSVIGFTPGLATMGEYGFTLLPVGAAIHFVLLAILAALLAKLYLRKASTPMPPREGLRAAAIMAVTGLALDAAVTVPFFVKSYSHYYAKWTLWAGVAVFVIVFSWIASQKQTKPQ